MVHVLVPPNTMVHVLVPPNIMVHVLVFLITNTMCNIYIALYFLNNSFYFFEMDIYITMHVVTRKHFFNILIENLEEMFAADKNIRRVS